MFDTDAFRSFVSAIYVKMFELDMGVLEKPIFVATLIEKSLITDLAYKSCKLSIDSFEFVVDLMMLEISGLDVILGIDLLFPNHIT